MMLQCNLLRRTTSIQRSFVGANRGIIIFFLHNEVVPRSIYYPFSVRVAMIYVRRLPASVIFVGQFIEPYCSR